MGEALLSEHLTDGPVGTVPTFPGRLEVSGEDLCSASELSDRSCPHASFSDATAPSH